MKTIKKVPNRLWTYGLSAALGLLAVGAFFILVILPLLSPPPDVEEPYQFAVSDESSVELVAGQDYLVDIQDGEVSVYIPSSSHVGQAVFTLRTRHPAFVPNKSDEEFERLRAVDLLLSLESGDPIEGAAFREPILLCFRLSESQQAALRQEPEMYSIQHYQETSGVGQWVSLDPAPGWENGQLCSLVDHLSLFALVENLKVSGRSAKDVTTPAVTVVPPAIYAVPTATAEP